VCVCVREREEEEVGRASKVGGGRDKLKRLTVGPEREGESGAECRTLLLHRVAPADRRNPRKLNSIPISKVEHDRLRRENAKYVVSLRQLERRAKAGGAEQGQGQGHGQGQGQGPHSHSLQRSPWSVCVCS
jgi:hypothetical protein